MLTSSYILFRNNILNVCIIFLWFNAMYIIPIFYCTALYLEHTVGPTLNYIKWFSIWSYIYENRINIQHEFISEFIAVVYYFSIYGCHIYYFLSDFSNIRIPNPLYG